MKNTLFIPTLLATCALSAAEGSNLSLPRLDHGILEDAQQTLQHRWEQRLQEFQSKGTLLDKEIATSEQSLLDLKDSETKLKKEWEDKRKALDAEYNPQITGLIQKEKLTQEAIAQLRKKKIAHLDEQERLLKQQAIVLQRVLSAEKDLEGYEQLDAALPSSCPAEQTSTLSLAALQEWSSWGLTTVYTALSRQR